MLHLLLWQSQEANHKQWREWPQLLLNLDESNDNDIIHDLIMTMQYTDTDH